MHLPGPLGPRLERGPQAASASYAGWRPRPSWSGRTVTISAPGKNFYASGSIGPWIVTADEAGDLGEAELTTRVNGELRQQARIKDMIFSVAELIAYISAFTPLNPGDVIGAGTPGGVGLS